jgi:hypothetical protein
MNPRERLVAIAVLVFIMLFSGAFLVYEFYLLPREDRAERIHKLQDEVNTKQALRKDVEKQEPKITEARALSLPSDVAQSGREYDAFLSKLVKESGIPLGGPSGFKTERTSTAETVHGPTFGTKKGPFLTPLIFHLSGRTDLEHLVKLLERFYAAPMLHRIKSLRISQPSNFAGAAAKPREGFRSRDLEVDMIVEAVIVNGTANHNLPTPASAAAAQATGSTVARSLARKPADYAAVLANNIFYGPPPPPVAPQEGPDITKSIQLVFISRPAGEDERGCEAILWNQADNDWTRLCPKEGRETFQYKNKLGELRVQGTVVRIDDEDVVFRVGDDLYQIHLDETLDKALARRPLTDSQLRAMKLTRASGNGGAQ